jgi:hypothetical protein
LDELDEKPSHTKIQSLEILEERVVMQRIQIFNHLTKTIMFDGFKTFSFKCKSHVQEIILPKNMFGYPLKLILKFYGIFYVYGYKPKYSYTLMYECENSHHHMNYLKLDYSNFLK